MVSRRKWPPLTTKPAALENAPVNKWPRVANIIQVAIPHTAKYLSLSAHSTVSYRTASNNTSWIKAAYKLDLTFSEFWCISGRRRINRLRALICSFNVEMFGMYAKERMYSRVRRGLGSSRRNCFSREATSDTRLSSHENSPQLYSVSSSCLMACNTRGGSAGRELGGWQQEGEEEEIGGEEEGEAKSKAGESGVLRTFSMSSPALQTQLSVSLYYTLQPNVQ